MSNDKFFFRLMRQALVFILGLLLFSIFMKVQAKEIKHCCKNVGFSGVSCRIVPKFAYCGLSEWEAK